MYKSLTFIVFDGFVVDILFHSDARRRGMGFVFSNARVVSLTSLSLTVNSLTVLGVK